MTEDKTILEELTKEEVNKVSLYETIKRRLNNEPRIAVVEEVHKYKPDWLTDIRIEIILQDIYFKIAPQDKILTESDDLSGFLWFVKEMIMKDLQPINCFPMRSEQDYNRMYYIKVGSIVYKEKIANSKMFKSLDVIDENLVNLPQNPVLRHFLMIAKGEACGDMGINQNYGRAIILTLYPDEQSAKEADNNTNLLEHKFDLTLLKERKQLKKT